MVYYVSQYVTDMVPLLQVNGCDWFIVFLGIKYNMVLILSKLVSINDQKFNIMFIYFSFITKTTLYVLCLYINFVS